MDEIAVLPHPGTVDDARDTLLPALLAAEPGRLPVVDCFHGVAALCSSSIFSGVARQRIISLLMDPLAIRPNCDMETSEGFQAKCPERSVVLFTGCTKCALMSHALR